MLKKDLIKRFVKLSREVHMIEQELGLIVDAKGTEKKIKYCPELYKESLKNTNLERHLFIPDLHIPDHNQQAVDLLVKFIPDFQPHVVHILGDFLNFTKVSGFPEVGVYKTSLEDEIKVGRNILGKIMEASGDAKILWYEGNHERRLQKELGRGHNVLAEIENEMGEQLISIPSIFRLKELGIEWLERGQYHKLDSTLVEHGDIVRGKSGYTAHAMLDRRGLSGFSGHTHRLAMVTRKQGDSVKFWIECGSLANSEPTPLYTIRPDWQTGFAVGIFDKKNDIMHPVPILMQRGEFYFNDKIYR
jgi:hypothetical protein